MATWVREDKKASENRQRKREAEEADKVEVAPGVTVASLRRFREAEEADKVEVAPGVTVASLRRFRAALIVPTQGLPKRRWLCR